MEGRVTRTRARMAVPVVAAAMALVSIPAAGAAPHAAPAHGVAAPVAVGTLRIAGTARDGAQVRAAGLRWHPGPLRPGQTLLSFQVGYEWRACNPADGSCRMGSDSTATPFAAARYVVGHRDVGRQLRLVETATEVVETDPATFTFRVLRASRRGTSPEIVRAFARGRAPTMEFLNGLPEKTTGSNAENFQVPPPHFNTADGRPAMQYRVDGRRWRTLRPTRVFGTGELGLGEHRVSVRAENRAG